MRAIAAIITLSFSSGILAQVFEGYGMFTDPRDGQQYITVEIGTQTWMAENMNYKTHSGSWAYENNPTYTSTYGRLYNWPAAIEACPAGWHLPGDDDWMTLEHFLGMDLSEKNTIGWRGKDEGSRLKTTSGWNSGGNGHNESGFSALPGGFSDGKGGFGGIGVFAYFWTSTELTNKKEAWTRKLYHPTRAIGRSNYNKRFGFSVRCVKDNE